MSVGRHLTPGATHMTQQRVSAAQGHMRPAWAVRVLLSNLMSPGKQGTSAAGSGGHKAEEEVRATESVRRTCHIVAGFEDEEVAGEGVHRASGTPWPAASGRRRTSTLQPCDTEFCPRPTRAWKRRAHSSQSVSVDRRQEGRHGTYMKWNIIQPWKEAQLHATTWGTLGMLP